MNEECELFELDPPAMTIEKSFFTHYTICKYIDDLPEEWSVRDDKEDELNVRCSKVGANIELDSNGSCKRVLFARPLSTCQLKKNANQNLSDSESEKSKTDSSRKKSEKFKSNNFTKNCKEFLPQKNDNQKTKNTEADEMKKELSATAAGKSDSRIGSFNEQYEEYVGSKFTQEALAKHTIEQDELYTEDLLRKIKHSSLVENYSGKI